MGKTVPRMVNKKLVGGGTKLLRAATDVRHARPKSKLGLDDKPEAKKTTLQKPKGKKFPVPEKQSSSCESAIYVIALVLLVPCILALLIRKYGEDVVRSWFLG